MRRFAYLAILALSPSLLSAQADIDAIRRRNDCRLAIQIVSRGTPDAHRDWALMKIAACGREGAAALAPVLLSLRTTRDTAVLNRYFAPTRLLRDRRIFEAATRMATDPGAATEARVFAIRTLVWALNPGYFLHYGDLAGGARRRNCTGSFGTHVDLSKGEPLPADYAQEVRRVGIALNADPSVPAEVRSAAVCARLLRQTPWLEVWEQES